MTVRRQIVKTLKREGFINIGGYLIAHDDLSGFEVINQDGFAVFGCTYFYDLEEYLRGIGVLPVAE